MERIRQALPAMVLSARVQVLQVLLCQQLAVELPLHRLQRHRRRHRPRLHLHAPLHRLLAACQRCLCTPQQQRNDLARRLEVLKVNVRVSSTSPAATISYGYKKYSTTLVVALWKWTLFQRLRNSPIKKAKRLEL